MIINKILWKLQVPALAIIQGPFFKVQPKRRCEISFSIEAEDGSEKAAALLFEGVEAFRCTYLTSLDSISHEWRNEAYGNLIQFQSSPWLTEVSNARSGYHAKMSAQLKSVQHLMICFDDGPCYEFICESFHAL
jgi:hypothetical protein